MSTFILLFMQFKTHTCLQKKKKKYHWKYRNEKKRGNHISFYCIVVFIASCFLCISLSLARAVSLTVKITVKCIYNLSPFVLFVQFIFFFSSSFVLFWYSRWVCMLFHRDCVYDGLAWLERKMISCELLQKCRENVVVEGWPPKAIKTVYCSCYLLFLKSSRELFLNLCLYLSCLDIYSYMHFVLLSLCILICNYFIIIYVLLCF